MNDEILIYIKRDEHDSIVSISSDIFIDDLTGWEKVDEWIDGEDRYIYAHADNGDYVLEKHEKPLYDENGIPNFHDDWIEWTEEEKAEKYPIPEPQPSEQDLINADIYLQLAQLQMNSISVITIQSPRYDILKGYYDMGIYNNESMKVFVSCGWISSEEYEQITSRKYHEDML